MGASAGHDVREVVVTGVGLVTPLGHSAWSTFTALLGGRTTADRLAELPEDVEPSVLAKATAGIGFGANAPVDPAIEIGEHAARAALADAGIEPRSAESARTAMVLASSKGAILSLIAPRQPSHRAENLMLGPHGFLARQIQNRLGLGDTSAPVAACATSLTALDRAVKAVQGGECERVVVIAVESALHPLFVHSYRRLGALAPTSPVRAHVARPLDAKRHGFTLCECAAAVVLELENSSRAISDAREPLQRRRAWARILDTCCVSEPFDLIRAPARFAALERCVRQVTAHAETIALVQPHATGTPDNDEEELAALSRALGARAEGAAVYASKGAIGHGLGAAGLVNVVLSCLCGRAKRRPPMPWLIDPVKSPFSLNSETTPVESGAHVCVAAGFGGHVGAVCLAPT